MSTPFTSHSWAFLIISRLVGTRKGNILYVSSRVFAPCTGRSWKKLIQQKFETLKGSLASWNNIQIRWEKFEWHRINFHEQSRSVNEKLYKISWIFFIHMWTYCCIKSKRLGTALKISQWVSKRLKNTISGRFEAETFLLIFL